MFAEICLLCCMRELGEFAEMCLLCWLRKLGKFAEACPIYWVRVICEIAEPYLIFVCEDFESLSRFVCPVGTGGVRHWNFVSKTLGMSEFAKACV